MLDEEEEYDDSIVSAHSDVNTPVCRTVFWSSFWLFCKLLWHQDLAKFHDCIFWSILQVPQCAREGNSKTLWGGGWKGLNHGAIEEADDEHEPEQRKKIKRRNQAIYAAVDDNDTAWYVLSSALVLYVDTWFLRLYF